MNIRSHFLPSATALVIAAASAVPAGAQERDTVMLREIVVTATRLPTPRDAVPNAVTVVTGDELRARGATHVLDALRQVPGAHVVQSGSFGGVTSLFLRGGESDYVRVLVDGVPVNQPGGSYNLADLTVDNVDRLEIVRGPTSVLYGSDAVAGVVQIFTRRGQGALRGSAGVRGGSYGSTAVDASLAGGGGPVGYSLAASRFFSDGVYRLNNQYRNATASGSVRVVPDERSEAQVSLRLFDGEFHFPTNFAGFPSDSNQFSTSRGLTVSADIGRFITQRVEARLLLGWNETDDRTENAPDSPAEQERSSGRTELRRRSVDARFNVRLAPAALATAGGVVEDQEFSNVLSFDGSFGPFADSLDVSRTNRALYAQLHAGGAEPWSVTLGARLEDNQAFGTYGTYRVGGSYRVAPSTLVRAAYGTAFKEPTMFENYGGGFSTGNPDLEPERAHSAEVGVEQVVAAGTGVLSVTAFDQRFRNLIQYDGSVPFGEPNYRNIAGADARGAEFEVRVSPAEATRLTMRYTYLHTSVDDPGLDTISFERGRRLLRRPTHAASVSIERRFGRRTWLGATLQWVGDRDDLDFRNSDPITFRPPRVVLPSYARLDLAAEHQLLLASDGRPGFTATLRVDNLADASYEEVLYYPARGRTIFAGGRVSFAR
jgi:vitamin B12 transporter